MASIVSRQIYCIQGRRYIDLFTLGDAFHIEASFASDLWEEGPPDNPLTLRSARTASPDVICNSLHGNTKPSKICCTLCPFWKSQFPSLLAAQLIGIPQMWSSDAISPLPSVALRSGKVGVAAGTKRTRVSFTSSSFSFRALLFTLCRS